MIYKQNIQINKYTRFFLLQFGKDTKDTKEEIIVWFCPI